MFSVGCTWHGFVAIWIPVGLSSGLPRCDPLTIVPLCDHEWDLHSIRIGLTCCVTVVSSVARTIRKTMDENPRDSERTPIYYYCQIRRGDRTRFLERFSRKLNQGFGRTYADPRAAFTAQRLQWHGLQYNSFPLLYNSTLERKRRWATEARIEQDYDSRR